ncbi:Uncharacterized protein CEY00_Acc20495 [Actinidia chinensis var. chinensis]|uniref:Uncharacterized protein n=1 Tax=Actinidia chinensis var. chinensis TaxID=1590841 RepID=A0A2R6Q9R2_ACTCC|nr:Uncharacterized protein CEY00_Acc20495 [Actinidia chinensis var. chinensis]
MEENSNPNTDHQDEAEETLSFCDLPIYSSSDSAEWDKFSKEDHSFSCLSSSSSSSSSSHGDFFEFFSEDYWSSTTSTTSPLQGNIVFCGKLIPFKEPLTIITTRELESPKKGGGSVVAAQRAKSRWQLLMFGLVRLPASEMEMRDIRIRQRQRRRRVLAVGLGGKTGGEEGKGKGKGKGGKGLWGLIRAMGCGGSHSSNEVVEAQFGCISRV